MSKRILLLLQLQVAFETDRSFSDGFQGAKRYSTGLEAMDGDIVRVSSVLLETPRQSKEKGKQRRWRLIYTDCSVSAMCAGYNCCVSKMNKL